MFIVCSSGWRSSAAALRITSSSQMSLTRKLLWTAAAFPNNGSPSFETELNWTVQWFPLSLTRLSDKWGRKNVLLGACVVFLIVYTGFSLAENIVALIVLFLLYGFYQGSFRSMTRGIASDLAPEQLRASAIGWFSATIGLCQLAAGLIAGTLWDQFGHTSAFMYGMASAAAGILGLVILIRPTKAAEKI